MWLEDAKRDNVWDEVSDALQTSVLHGMLCHVRDACSEVVNNAGPEVIDTITRLRTLASPRSDAE